MSGLGPEITCHKWICWDKGAAVSTTSGWYRGRGMLPQSRTAHNQIIGSPSLGAAWHHINQHPFAWQVMALICIDRIYWHNRTSSSRNLVSHNIGERWIKDAIVRYNWRWGNTHVEAHLRRPPLPSAFHLSRQRDKMLLWKVLTTLTNMCRNAWRQLQVRLRWGWILSWSILPTWWGSPRVSRESLATVKIEKKMLLSATCLQHVCNMQLYLDLASDSNNMQLQRHTLRLHNGFNGCWADAVHHAILLKEKNERIQQNPTESDQKSLSSFCRLLHTGVNGC